VSRLVHSRSLQVLVGHAQRSFKCQTNENPALKSPLKGCMAPMADTANSAILPFPSIHTSSPTKHPRRLSVVCHWCVGDSRARLSIARRLFYRTWMGASISRITHRTNHRPKEIFSLRICSGRRQHMELPPASRSQRPASFSGAFSHGRTWASPLSQSTVVSRGH
jgi:hypothetical protein